ncbi:SGNH/GDSL hydrolase family protein [Agrococcus beijingensis]|uniref:SGNH/GDSL hydrolase family protein n=1 Tax=Agrococcus beijingensis TaxID=3068634 RepID=UPI00274285C5|nr:SGNH/GDSL hydrolase family protein [Agrococcus sp. REN33]
MQRRMLAIVAALALGASTLLGAAPATAAGPPAGGFAYVALGDSEAAGTGLMPRLQLGCLRTLKAYPIVIAPTFGGVASHACAGATTGDATDLDRQPGTAVQQARDAIAAGRLGPATELVTITVGINDIGWQSIVLACSSVGIGSCEAELFRASVASMDLPQRIAGLVATVRAATGFDADIVVAGYPLLFGRDLTAPCELGSFRGAPVTVSEQQATVANNMVAGINQWLAAGVSGSSATFVDIAAAFEGHSLCDTSGPWVSGLVNGKKTTDRGLHLNWPGQRAYAAAILAAL